MKPEKLVRVWMAGLAVLLDRRYAGYVLIPTGRKVAEALELPPAHLFDEANGKEQPKPHRPNVEGAVRQAAKAEQPVRPDAKAGQGGEPAARHPGKGTPEPDVLRASVVAASSTPLFEEAPNTPLREVR